MSVWWSNFGGRINQLSPLLAITGFRSYGGSRPRAIEAKAATQ